MSLNTSKSGRKVENNKNLGAILSTYSFDFTGKLLRASGTVLIVPGSKRYPELNMRNSNKI